MASDEYLSGPAPTFPAIYGSNMPLNQQLSPYLNINPNVFRNSQPQYIMPEGANPRRGMLELAFSQIGGAVMLGYGYGCSRGALAGYQDKELKAMSSWVNWRGGMITRMGRLASASAGVAGGIVMMYAIGAIIIGKLRGVEDELNSVLSGGAVGALYKSPQGFENGWQGFIRGTGAGGPGFVKVAGGGLAGLMVAGTFTMLNPQSRQRLTEMGKTMVGN